MKKLIALLAVLSIFATAFTGCGTKTECDFCGEVKRCETKTMLGEEIYVCNDCMDEINSLFG